MTNIPSPIGFNIHELHCVHFADILIGIQLDGVGDNGIARLVIIYYMEIR